MFKPENTPCPAESVEMSVTPVISCNPRDEAHHDQETDTGVSDADVLGSNQHAGPSNRSDDGTNLEEGAAQLQGISRARSATVCSRYAKLTP
jgi:hypothetical protein